MKVIEFDQLLYIVYISKFTKNIREQLQYTLTGIIHKLINPFLAVSKIVSCKPEKNTCNTRLILPGNVIGNDTCKQVIFENHSVEKAILELL